MKRLTLDDIKIAPPDFSGSKLPKGQVISQWLIALVEHMLEHGIADIGDIIPSKEELAKFLGVSGATVQNSIRHVKNLGYFSSKQSFGTSICDFYSKDLKEDELYHGSIAESKIKKLVLDDKTPLMSALPSVKDISNATNISQNTIRQALSNLMISGYLEKKRLRGNKYVWIYIKEFKISPQELSNCIQDENSTLTHQLIEKIKEYLEKTYKQGDRILSNMALCAMFNVSIKTVNDAMKILSSKNIVLPRRGRYGTIYLGENKNPKKDFVSSERKKSLCEKFIYSWQKALEHLKKHIVKNYEAGDKLPPIRELASILNVSPNTVRRAMESLVKSGHLYPKAGKSGGMFINEIPEIEGDLYRWLALNPKAVEFEGLEGFQN